LLEMYAKTRLSEKDYLEEDVEPDFMEEAEKAQRELARRSERIV